MMYILLIIGFAFLIKGADFFVDGSSNVAKKLNISPLIIGLTIVAFGTSMPEASVSISAGLAGSNELALSNVIGSNIFNLLLIIGICVLFKSMKMDDDILKREFPFSILASIVLWIMSSKLFIESGSAEGAVSIISRSEGLILLSMFAIFMYSLIMDALKSNASMTQEEREKNKQISILKNVILLVMGLVGIIVGGNLVVDNATLIATSLGVSQTLIGLTIVAVGTSLPELVTSIIASTKGENDIAIGNVIGSNIFNILFILGASGTINPLLVSADLTIDIAILIVISIIGFIFALTGKKIEKKEGIIMLLIYGIYLIYMFYREGLIF